ncbi:gamma-glutamylcyclotransferase family protein [Maliponia aquimaris]|uniref:AIG2-like family protein n=1 Tax=Maliponia aquimaris TaxID=1673631 RepID=A0A238K7R0_9RHOB|nr:gamma-glutamylcyclotransferase family protein [Maliponia aquimaris]SMX38928.1 AIG2-like family protein [Maliponia aquimaris]
MHDCRHLFVYGTMLTVADRPMGRRLRAESDFVGYGWIRACLYHIEDPESPGSTYPGAVPSGYDKDRVHGELYRLHDPQSLFEVFDVYEACDPKRPEPHEFQRRRVPVTLDGGAVIPALCYFYSWDLSRATRVPSGLHNRVPQTAR